MIRGILFDLNGTLIDILTDEGDPAIFRTVANFLNYRNLEMSPEECRDFYFDHNRKQRHNSPEKYPEFDVTAIFRDMIAAARPLAGTVPADDELPRMLSQIFRAASRKKLALYDQAIPVLRELRRHYRLEAVSDGQRIWAEPEWRQCGLDEFFTAPVVSSDYGYRKPDERLFRHGLARIGLKPEETIYVGNDLYRDVLGAARLGMKTVFFRSNQGDWTEQEREPDYRIYSLSELPAAISFLAARA